MCTVDVDWSKGACSGTVYSGDDKIAVFMSKVRKTGYMASQSFFRLSILSPVFWQLMLAINMHS